MTDKDKNTIDAAIHAGKPVFVGEWRGFTAETINYTNKKGAAASFGRLSHTVEIGEGDKFEAVTVSTSVQDGVDPKTVTVPLKRGQRVLVYVEGLEVDRGHKNFRSSQLLPLS